MAELGNRYFHTMGASKEFVPWQPPAVPDEVDLPDSIYFGQVLAEMDSRLDATGLTFYVTQDVERLPSYGNDVVVLLMSDEFTRVPDYFARVRAIFKNQAVRPFLTSSVLREPSWVNFWWLVAWVRMWRHHAPGAISYLFGKARPGTRPAPIWLLPIGVLNQPELPIKPLAERTTDVFFAGSVVHRPGAVSKARERLAPKTLAREAMLREAERLAAKHPELSVELVTTREFVDSIVADPRTYAEGLMDSKIALVPRGTTAETSRFWQALRYGCVAAVDTLPRHRWFYDGAPVVRVGTWDELEDVVVPLLGDPDRLRELHERSLEWWRTRGSPEAVGAYMAEKLNRLGP